MPRLCSSLLLSLLIASSASAVSTAWTPIGNPGNACDPHLDWLGAPTCSGAVGYTYSIGTYEVTNAQYAEFLNAKAASDPLGLYNPNMGDSSAGYWGGIARSEVSGSFTYSAIGATIFLTSEDASRDVSCQRELFRGLLLDRLGAQAYAG